MGDTDIGLISTSVVIDSECYSESFTGGWHVNIQLDPNCADDIISFVADIEKPIYDPCPPPFDPVISHCQFSGVIPIVTPSIVCDSNPTGPPLEYLTFDSDGIARVRLRIHPDPRAEIHHTKMSILANGIEYEGNFPFKYSENDMIFTDPIYIYRDVYDTMPDLQCDAMIIPAPAHIESAKYICAEAHVIKVDFLMEQTPTPGMQPTDTLKISKWENAFDVIFDPTPVTPTPIFNPNFIETDPYRFQIRVVDMNDTDSDPGTLKILTRRWHDQTPIPVDQETEMFLHPQGTPGVWITDPMILVSDQVDDEYFVPQCPIFGVQNNEPNDRTHRVTIDSEIVARYYPNMTDPTPTPDRMAPPEAVLNTPTPFVVEKIATMEYKTFRFHPVIFEIIDDEGNPIPVIDPLWVAANFEDIKNIYASVGVKIEMEPIRIIYDSSLNIEEVYVNTDNFENILASADPNDELHMFFVRNLFREVTATPTNSPHPDATSTPVPTITPTPAPGATQTPTPTPLRLTLAGVARIHNECTNNPPPGYDNVVMNAYIVETHNLFLVSSHEIGHCLTRYGHYEKFGNLMSRFITEDKYKLHTSIYAGKRFSDTPLPTPTACNHTPTPKNQEDRIHEHDQVN